MQIRVQLMTLVYDAESSGKVEVAADDSLNPNDQPFRASGSSARKSFNQHISPTVPFSQALNRSL